MELNYNLEKTINHYRQNILCNTQLADIGLVDNNNRIELVLSSLINLRDLLILHESAKALTSLKVIKNDKAINNCFNEAQYQVIEATILFYQNNPTIDYPTDYQTEPEQVEISIKQVESPAQNIDQINFDKLMAEITDIKALSSEFKNLQSELKNITDAIKESTNKQTALKPEKVEAAPSDVNLAAKIELLTESVKKLEPFLTALTNPDLAYSELQSNMSKHIKDMNDIVTKNVENSRAQFELAISGDVAKMKSEMSVVATNLIKELGALNITNNENLNTILVEKVMEHNKIIELSFAKNNKLFEDYKEQEHINALKIIDLEKSNKIAKAQWNWFFGGLIVILLFVNICTVIYMKNNISTTTSTNVINAIKQMRDTQIKSPPPVTNHKKY